LVVDPAMIQLRIEPQNRDGAVVEALPQLRSLAGCFKLDDFAGHAHRTEKFVDVLHISPIMLMLGMADPIGSPVESRPRFMKRKRHRCHARRPVPSCPTADRAASKCVPPTANSGGKICRTAPRRLSYPMRPDQ